LFAERFDHAGRWPAPVPRLRGPVPVRRRRVHGTGDGGHVAVSRPAPLPSTGDRASPATETSRRSITRSSPTAPRSDRLTALHVGRVSPPAWSSSAGSSAFPRTKSVANQRGRVRATPPTMAPSERRSARMCEPPRQAGPEVGATARSARVGRPAVEPPAFANARRRRPRPEAAAHHDRCPGSPRRTTGDAATVRRAFGVDRSRCRSGELAAPVVARGLR